MHTNHVKAANPAYERLLQDYVDYHLALVVVGGFFALALLALGVGSWVRFRRAPRGVERRTHFVFAVAGSTVGLLLTVVVAANLSNVLNPRQGLAGAIGTPGDLKPAASGELTQSLTAWVRSGSAEVPQLIQNQVDARLAWQEPKAVITTLLLVLFAALSVVVWRSRHQAVAGRATSGRSGAGRVGDHAGVFRSDPHGHGEHAGVVRTDHDDAAVRLSRRQDSLVTVKLICHGCRVSLSTLSCHVYRPVGSRRPPTWKVRGRSIGTPGSMPGGRPTSVWTWMRIGDPPGSATG